MSALLIVDMQVGMTWPGPSVRNNPQAERIIADLLQACFGERWVAAEKHGVHICELEGEIVRH